MLAHTYLAGPDLPSRAVVSTTMFWKVLLFRLLIHFTISAQPYAQIHRQRDRQTDTHTHTHTHAHTAGASPDWHLPVATPCSPLSHTELKLIKVANNPER